MTHNKIKTIAASLFFALAATAVLAHAQLVKAIPAVGGSVASPSEIRLKFTEGVEPRFSGVALTDASGATEPLGAASVDPADHSVLIAKVSRTLPPGVYIVTWHVVSVDTHRTQGNFNFTVTP